jgi:hypothetical protein
MTAKPWKDFWDNFPGWARTAILIAVSGGAGIGGTNLVKGENATYWNEQDIRKIFREEMKPLKVGFLESIKSRPDREQLRIISAMSKAEEHLKNKGND